MARTLRHNRAHDYSHLIRRWRSVAAKTGLRLVKYSEAASYDLFYLESRRKRTRVLSLYLSAGIHGDEPAATEGLIVWAEKNIKLLSECGVLIFPCLNPWALVNNCRRDFDGRDLNRSYHTQDVPQITEQLKLIVTRKFDLAYLLHEDFDALGNYIYEVNAAKPYWSELILAAAKKHIAPDPRRKIEGRGAKMGVIRPRVSPELMPDWPEAFILHYQNVPRVFTVETPSEFHLDDRVEAHAAMLSKAVELTAKEFALRLRRDPAS